MANGMTQQQLMDLLEPLIDQNTVGSIVLAMARVCDEKSEHLRLNWQDAVTARTWETLSRRLDILANKTPV